MEKYPFKDPDVGFWVYDKIPTNMVLLTPKKIKLRQKILYRASLPPYKDKFLSDVVNHNNINIVKQLSALNSVWVQC
jgi:hypothetical protein